MMKLKTLLLLAIAIPLLFSCKKDGDTIYEASEPTYEAPADSYRIIESVSYWLELIPRYKNTYTYVGDKLSKSQKYEYIAGSWNKDTETEYLYYGDTIKIISYYKGNDTPNKEIYLTINNGNKTATTTYEYTDYYTGNEEKTLISKEYYKYDRGNLKEYLSIEFKLGLDYMLDYSNPDTISHKIYYYNNDTLTSAVEMFKTDSNYYYYEEDKIIKEIYAYEYNIWNPKKKTETIYSGADIIESSCFQYFSSWELISTLTYSIFYSKDYKKVENNEYGNYKLYEPGKSNNKYFDL